MSTEGKGSTCGVVTSVLVTFALEVLVAIAASTVEINFDSKAIILVCDCSSFCSREASRASSG